MLKSYGQFVACLMYSFQIVLWALFSLPSVKFLACVQSLACLNILPWRICQNNWHFALEDMSKKWNEIRTWTFTLTQKWNETSDHSIHYNFLSIEVRGRVGLIARITVLLSKRVSERFTHNLKPDIRYSRSRATRTCS